MVERGGLENRCAFAGTVGSNPTLSAILLFAKIKMLSLALVVACCRYPVSSVFRTLETGLIKASAWQARSSAFAVALLLSVERRSASAQRERK